MGGAPFQVREQLHHVSGLCSIDQLCQHHMGTVRASGWGPPASLPGDGLQHSDP